MKKVELLLNRYVKHIPLTWIMNAIYVLVLIGTIFMLFFTQIGNIFIYIFLVLASIYILVNQIYKNRLITGCLKNLANETEILTKLKNGLRFYHVYYSEEKEILKEIVYLLSHIPFYKERGTIGSLEIAFNKEKTAQYSQDIAAFDTDLFGEALKELNYLSKELEEFLNGFGIIPNKVIDWDLKSNDTMHYEMVYPLIGLVINDSLLLHRKKRFDPYKFSESIAISIEEGHFDEHQGLYLHIKWADKKEGV